MAIETADLASLIRKVREAQVRPGSEPEPFSAPEPVTAAPSPTPVPVPAVDLMDLHAELHADEVLLERILGLLYRTKKRNPIGGAVSILDMEKQLGLEREAATFVMDYMKSTKIIQMDDKSRMTITVPGIEYLRRSLGVAKVPAVPTE